MSIRHVKSDLQSKPQRWVFHHGAGRLRAGDATRNQPTTEGRPAPVVDAGDGGLVAPDLSGSLASHRNRQPPTHDYSRRTVGREALASIRDLRDEDCSGGPIWVALLGDNTSEGMRQFIGLVLAFIFLSAVFFWFLA
ncbi:hypothetical protein [Ensifer sp. ZNC0028]|uniref:hypothetical protein n=1 Tax=Ensifer sp. ZNC0028 TaxID=1339236 RepID=UPI0005B8A02E|nr:hypothetical protein [Ensifer sp. ZNC0028]